MVLAVARKTLLELLREPHLPGIAILFPAMLVIIYYAAFGQPESGLAAMLDVRVVNHDIGATRPDGSSWNAGAELVEHLRAEELDGAPVFAVTTVTDPGAALVALREQKTTLLLTIDADLSERLLHADAGDVFAFHVVGDRTNPSFGFANAFLGYLTREYVHEAMGLAPGPELATEFLLGTGTAADLHYAVAALIPFGIMLLILCSATVLVREAVSGTLARLRLSRATAAHVHGGITLAHMGLAVVVVAVVFGTAFAFGFPTHGQLLLSVVAAMLLALSSVGLGLIVACFAKSDTVAISLASAVALPMSLLSGALFPLPAVPVGTVFGATIDVFDILPTTHAVEVMRRALVHGDGVAELWYEFGGLTVLSTLCLLAGIALYQRRRMALA